MTAFFNHNLLILKKVLKVPASDCVTLTEKERKAYIFNFYIKNSYRWRTIPLFIENKGLIRN